jgi:hypothetical protein
LCYAHFKRIPLQIAKTFNGRGRVNFTIKLRSTVMIFLLLSPGFASAGYHWEVGGFCRFNCSEPAEDATCPNENWTSSGNGCSNNNIAEADCQLAAEGAGCSVLISFTPAVYPLSLEGQIKPLNNNSESIKSYENMK